MDQNPASTKTKIFFPNLDGLRFLSFFAVFLYHCYLSFFAYLEKSSPILYKTLGFLFQNGFLGVNFFFVLSGFLITYLLIREKELKSSIHIGNFYLRRILRIWPLYYICLIIGFLIFPILKGGGAEGVQESADPVYYALFLANFDYMNTWPVKPEALILSVLWSVAVEEQFYLTWPLILGLLPIRKYQYVFPVIILASLIFRSFYTDDTDRDDAVRYFHTLSLIGDMALGGLMAFYCSYESKFKQFVTNMGKPVILAIYLLTAAIMFFKDQLFFHPVLVVPERLIIGSLFGLIILEQNYAIHSFFKLGRFRIISQLGVYTYGLYCLHLLGMYVAVKLVTAFKLDQTTIAVSMLSAFGGLIVSTIVAISSYHLFEKRFLNLKSRFSSIVTK